MKNLIILLLLLFSVSVVSAQSIIRAQPFYTSPTGAIPVWTNLISCWPMIETSGGIAYDVSPTGDNATVTGATQTANGVVFDGTSGNYLTISTPAFGTADFTIILIINPTATSSPFYRNILFGPTNSFLWSLYVNRRPRALITGGGGSTPTSITLTYGVENMLAVVRSGNNFRFFINGSFETQAYTADFTAGLDEIGGYQNSTYLAFLGTMRNIFIFDDAKADSYITAFYNSGSYTDYADGDPE